jgi:hypothetical protein
MNCLEFRRTVGAEPQRSDPAIEAHARTCAACAEFQREMLALDRRIAVALRVPVPRTGGISRTLPLPRARFAVAASVLLAVAAVVFFSLWLPRPSLAAEIVEHVQHESASWSDTTLVSNEELAAIADKTGVNIDPALGPVSYAMACPFRGRVVPHLVVRDAQGPVTVLVLPGEKLSGRQRFSEDGLSGVLMPAPRGAIAVLTRDAARVDSVAARLLEAIH